MDARSRFFTGAGVVLALAAGSLTLAAVRAEEGKDAAPPAAAAGDADALVKSLADPDFATREKAYARLKELGAGARGALDRGAASEDAQIRWASKRLLGLLDDGGGEGGATGRLRFDDEGEDEGSEDHPALSGDPFRTEFPDINRTLEEMRRRMEDLQRQFDGLDRRELSLQAVPGGGATVERHVVVDRNGERTEVHVASDGKVKVTLGHRADGAEKTETFEAPDVASLEKDHPEVWAKVKDLVREDGVSVLRIDPVPAMPRLAFPRNGTIPDRLRFGAPATPRGVLGVTVSPVPELLRAHVKVPAGEGLVVEEVLPGTPAERLGLRRLDLLLSVNGIPVSTAEDVRSAVGAVKEGGPLRLGLLREGRETVVEGTR